MADSPKTYPLPSDDEMAALLRAVVDACPDLLPDNDPQKNLVQEVVGRAMEFAAKWSSDVDKAMMANGGNAGTLVAAEVVAYGALSAIFKHYPSADLRRQLYAAGVHVGQFIVERWQANARQDTFRQNQREPA